MTTEGPWNLGWGAHACVSPVDGFTFAFAGGVDWPAIRGYPGPLWNTELFHVSILIAGSEHSVLFSVAT